MGTKIFAPSGESFGQETWNNPANWVGGLPLPGDTAVIDGKTAALLQTTLTLDDINVDLGSSGEIVGGNASDLILLDSQVDLNGAGTGIAAAQIEIDRMSFILGTAQPNSFLGNNIYAYQITNDGTIGVERSGAQLSIGEGYLPRTDLGSTGQLVASNGGQLQLNNTDVNGIGGHVTVANGGSLALTNSTIGSTEQVSLGGQDKTTLSIDPSSSIAAPISGFLPTDTIDLLDFRATAIALTGTVNPALIAINALFPFAGGGPLEVINLSGNYAHYAFSFSRDAAGTGTDITVHPVA